ncbi:MAG: hypothetical protein APF76_09830 [Desulfitibacter sp. BRH_c19]|nr:MAG: hypothetical protein APF76_09830 [Desulfitibacter sp. BRH_c19]
MEIIDCHIHFSAIQLFAKTAQEVSNVKYSRVGLEDELEQCNIIRCIGMGVTETTPGKFPDADSPNPMNLDLETPPSQLHSCLGINPVKIKYDNDEKELKNIDLSIKDKNSKVIGLKVYPGYYPYDLTDSNYQQIYQLAKKHKLPVVIHCGDTFCEKGHLGYSHPIEVNKIAMQHRDVKFVIAHFGNPWVVDAAMVISNNPNVYADLSGLTIGSKKEISKARASLLLTNHIKTGLAYVGDYSKFMFGSDWPLVQLKPYISYVKKLMPAKFHRKVFYENAIRVFGL